MRGPSRTIVGAVVFVTIALTLFHFTDNAVNVDKYPKAGWQPDWFEWVVVAGWFIYTAIGYAGYRAFADGRLRTAHACLIVYGLAVASSLAHFLYGSPSDMPIHSAISVFVDVATGLAVIAVALWSMAAQRSSAAESATT